MRSSVVGRLVLLGAILMLPARLFAQEATLTGTVSDSTGGVLPGVTVTALHEATGNTFVAVTDERGIYRIPARVGNYRINAVLQGFATVERTGLELRAGQTSTINLQMSPSTLQETVTVTGEAPLLRVATSSLGGNIDPLQVQEMPSEGRNWMALLLLAPGSRSTSANPAEPLETRNANRTREYQTNVDGMQFANTMGGGGQPAFSQEMIAEFQYISNRFDATQGRSSGVQVNMITKSGTNRYAGSFRGNFRDDRFNASNPVLNRVVPIKNQQFASSFGGPDHARQAAFLRLRRVRARAENRGVEYAVPAFQRRARRHVHRQARGAALRLSVLAADAADGQGQQDRTRTIRSGPATTSIPRRRPSCGPSPTGWPRRSPRC